MATVKSSRQFDLKKTKETKSYKVFDGDSKAITPVYVSNEFFETLGSPESIKVTVEAG